MRKLAALIGVLVLMMAAAPALAALGDSDALFSVMTYTDREYDVGSTVDLVVHVFEAGKYVNATKVTVQVGSDYLDPHMVNVTEQGTGKYAGSFVIEERDITRFDATGLGGWVSMMATVVKDTMYEMAYTSINLKAVSEEPLIITPRLSPTSSYGAPGDIRTITWEVRHRGALVDPSEVSLTVDGSTVTSPVKTSVGIYSYAYTFPAGTTSRSQVIGLSVNCLIL